MATVNTFAMTQAKQFGNTPFGNVTALPFNLTVNASGVAINTDQSTAVQIADVLRLGILPAGMQLQDVQNTISVAMSASTTASLGFLYKDGVDVAAPYAQDAAYFYTGLSTASTGVSRKTAVKAPLTLPKDAYLVLTVAGAAYAQAGVIDCIVLGINTGDVVGSLASQQNP
jgi:hypothetical protein